MHLIHLYYSNEVKSNNDYKPNIFFSETLASLAELVVIKHLNNRKLEVFHVYNTTYKNAIYCVFEELLIKKVSTGTSISSKIVDDLFCQILNEFYDMSLLKNIEIEKSYWMLYSHIFNSGNSFRYLYASIFSNYLYDQLNNKILKGDTLIQLMKSGRNAAEKQEYIENFNKENLICGLSSIINTLK